jgi:adenylate cyclase
MDILTLIIKSLKHNYKALAILIVTMIFMLFSSLNGFVQLNRFCGDLLFRLRRPLPSPNNVLIVEIDEKSKTEIGARLWSRSLYAKALHNLTDDGARLVAFDYVFENLDEHDPVGDLAFANEIKRSGNVLLSAYFYPKGKAPVLNQELFSKDALGEGFINIYDDSDGEIRSMPLMAMDVSPKGDGYNVYLTLGLEAARHVLHLGDDIGTTRSGRMKVGRRLIPVNDSGNMILNFRGPFRTYRYASFVDVLNNHFKRNLFRNKVVFIGTTVSTDSDFYLTPFSSTFGIKTLWNRIFHTSDNPSISISGVELHANVFSTIYDNKFITAIPRKIFLLLLLVVGFASGAALSPLRPRLQSMISLTIMTVIFGCSYISFVHFMVLIPFGAFVLLVFSNLIVLNILHRIHTYVIFGRYVPGYVVKQITEHPNLVHLGGENRDITILFSDIRSFSTISESMTPEQVVAMLNKYLGEMARIVYKYGGTIDKYIGDAVMAFWGAPLPHEDQTEKAVRCAVEMQKVVEANRTKWTDNENIELRIGVGLNRGGVIVGNIGSSKKMDFTIIGDAVNLASRLEGLTKQYKSKVVVSESVLEKTHDKFHVRELDYVAVKGKSKPTRIYEIIDVKD